MRPSLLAAGAFLLGAGVTFAATKALAPKPAEAVKPSPSSDEPSFRMDDKTLERANANLTASLQACNRKLSELGEAPQSPIPEPLEDAGGRRRGRRGGEPTKEDWDRMAQQGTLRTRIPCIRDTPWTPSARTVERLGLAPSDVEILKQAYVASNKRVLDQLRPLCTKALGTSDVLDKAGPGACMDAIANGARRSDPEGARKSIVGVAEMQSGKRPMSKPDANASAVEQLASLLASEQTAFEKDLEAKLGPEEAHRLAWAPELCSDRRMLRFGADDQ